MPGDEIVGFVTRGRGISIHRTDCVNILNLPEDERIRIMEADWESTDDQPTGSYVCEINLFARDRNGLLADISKVFTEKNISIMSLNTRTNKQGMVTMQLGFEVSGRDALNNIMERLHGIESVIDIERSIG